MKGSSMKVCPNKVSLFKMTNFSSNWPATSALNLAQRVLSKTSFCRLFSMTLICSLVWLLIEWFMSFKAARSVNAMSLECSKHSRNEFSLLMKILPVSPGRFSPTNASYIHCICWSRRHGRSRSIVTVYYKYLSKTCCNFLKRFN